MNEYISNLKNKYGYSDELLEFLVKLIPNLIKFYGEEYQDIILGALANCEIHFQRKDEDPITFLSSYFNVSKEWDMPDLGGAFYHNEIKVSDDKIEAKPIIYLKRIYYGMYMPFNFNDDTDVNTLIHEICHLIKGYGKLRIENDKIIDSTGLMKETYSYSLENGVVKEKEEMVGIEEAINEIESTQILEMVRGRKMKIIGYAAASYSATELLEHDDIAKILRISQFRGDDSWIQYLGEEQSKVLIENFDILVNAMYVPFSVIDNDEKREALYQKMGQVQEIISNFVNSYLPKDVDAFIQSLDIDNQISEVSSSIKR